MSYLYVQRTINAILNTWATTKRTVAIATIHDTQRAYRPTYFELLQAFYFNGEQL